MFYWWKVRCVDRSTRQLFDRYLAFDPRPTLPDQELQAALDILDDRKRRHELVSLRSHFREVEADELHQLMSHSAGSACVSPHEYFEDDAGNSLDLVALMTIRTGQADPIIAGNLDCVLRLPLASLVNTAGWSVDASNDVAHFLQLVGVLQSTAWHNGPLSLNNERGTLSLDCPRFQETLPIFALLRQLLFARASEVGKQDDVFRQAVQLYVAHCSDIRKVAWLLHEKQSFERFLLGRNRFGPECDLGGMSNGEVLDTLIYGTGILHRRSQKKREEQLARLQAKNDRRKLAFMLHWLCRQLLDSTVKAAVLIQQDFAHWVNEGLCPRPTRVVMESVLDPSGFIGPKED